MSKFDQQKTESLNPNQRVPMLKFLERFLIVLMIVAAAFTAQSVYSLIKEVRKPTKLGAIVRLNQGDRTFCTATVINPTTAVTAAHCIMVDIYMNGFGFMQEIRPDVEVRPESNKDLNIHAHVIYATTQLDMALLRGDFSLFEPKPYIQTIDRLMELQVPGKQFLSCGYPLGGPLQCTKTIYDQRVNFSIAVKGLLLPGMSGGPTMTEDGEVIAINNAVDGDVSIVTPIYNIDFNMAEPDRKPAGGN